MFKGTGPLIFKRAEELTYSMTGHGGKLYVIKIGGKIIDDEVALSFFLKEFSSVEGNKIMVHGGGSMATKMATQLGISQRLINGRRVTDADTLKIVTMVYAGYINKNIVAQLQGFGCNAFGLTGADGSSILAHKRIAQSSSTSEIENDYGYAGDIDEVNIQLLTNLIQQNYSLVIAPITHDGKGQLLNTNADTVAQEVATSLTPIFNVQLIYLFEKNGVLTDASDDSSIIKELTATSYKSYKEEGIISNGMLPKLDNAFTALEKGVKRVVVGHSEQLKNLIAGTSGTSIQNER